VNNTLDELAKTFDKDREYKAYQRYYNSGICDTPFTCDVSELEQKISDHYMKHGDRYVDLAIRVLEDPDEFMQQNPSFADELAYFDEHGYDDRIDSEIKPQVEKQLQLFLRKKTRSIAINNVKISSYNKLPSALMVSV